MSCIASNCDKKYKCKNYIENSDDPTCCDFSTYGSGSIGMDECKIERWCGNGSDFSMFKDEEEGCYFPKGLTRKLAKLYELQSQVSEYEAIKDLMSYDVNKPIKAKLVGKFLIGEDGKCLGEWQDNYGYAVYQCVGYCEDDFYGTIYAPLGNDVWLPIHYTC